MYISESITVVAVWIAFTMLILFNGMNSWWLLVPGVFNMMVWTAGWNRTDARKCAFSQTVSVPEKQ